ncbi:MAG: DUF4373 domain-containing protein, partial [Synergistaceae bacterium]|nr:DUF4373 domain-containing protein [Synergistaceae bacterium]
MGRPTKTGLDYFPLDVDIDDSIELIEAEYGIAGFGIVIKLWQKIYKNGYYIEWNDDMELLFARRINTEITLIKSVINSCFLRNIFNKHVFETYGVLTSHGIQKRYITACLTSKRKSISMNSSICLLNPELTRFITEFTEFPHEVSAQSKVKESKVKNNNMRTKLCATHISGGVDDFIKPNGHGPKEDKEDKEGSVQPYSFSEFWEFYDKKKDKQRAERAYKKISMRDRKCIFDTLQAYKDSTPNKKYRKNPEAYLNNRTWEDEIIPPDNDGRSKTPARVL